MKKDVSILKAIWKDGRRWLALLSVIIAFFWLVFVCTNYGNESTYYCSTGTDIPESVEMVPCTNLVQTFQAKEGRLNSLEFYFTDVPEEKVGSFVLTIESDEGILYQSSLSLWNLASDTWYRRYINIPMHEDVIYKLQLKAAEGTEAVPYVYIMDEAYAPSEAVSCYVNGMEAGAAASICYGYLKPYGTSDKAIQVLLVLFCLVAFWGVLATWECWKETRKKAGKRMYDFAVGNPSAFMLIQIILVRVIIEYSGIAFQPATEILFLLGSIFACLNIKEKLDYAIPILKNPKSKRGFLFLNFYAAFALVGNRMFIYPLDKTVTLGNILIFLTAAIWFLAVLLSAMYYYERLAIRLKRYKTGTISSVRFGIYAAILLILPAIVALYAFNPGISTPDTLYCMTAAHHLKGMGNWQAPFYIMLLSLIIKVWDSTYMVIAAQFFFWIYVMLEMLLLLRRRGWNEKLLIVAAFLTGCNVANFIHLCTIWKDIPYTLSVLWVTVILSKLVLESDRYQKSFYIYLELVVALVFMCLVRNNGIVPYILVGIFAAVLLWKNRRVLIAVSVSVVMVIMVRIPVYHYFEIQNTYTGGEYIGLGQDILGAYYAGGDLSEGTLEMVRVLTANNMGEFSFNPYWALSSYDLNVSKAEFIRNYIDTFLHNPIVMGREIICRQDAVWDLFDGEQAVLGCVGLLNSMDETSDVWASYYPRRNENVLTGQLSRVVQYSSTSQLLRITQWRMGLMTLLGVSSIFILFYKRKKIPFLIYVPILGHILSLMLSTGWSDFRYYWVINLVSWFIILLLPTITHDEESEKLEQKKQVK